MLGIRYAYRVIRSAWKKLTDGTLVAIDYFRWRRSPEVHHLIEPGQADYFKLRAGDVDVIAMSRFHEIVHGDELWAEFSPRIDAYYDYRPDLFPFETGSTHGSPNGETHWFEGQNFNVIEEEIAPHELIRLDLKKIRQRFPQEEDDPVGDRDVQEAISGLAVVFYENYRRLQKNRLGIITFAIASSFAIMTVLGAFAAIMMGQMAQADLDHVATLDRIFSDQQFVTAFILLMICVVMGLLIVPAAIMHVAEAELGHHKNRYDASTIGSNSAVSTLLVTRQENLCALVQQMFTHKDHDKESFWAQGDPRQVMKTIPRWEGLIFWNHARLGGNLEYLRIHTKAIGLIYVGLRSIARLKALLLMVLASVALTLICAAGVGIIWQVAYASLLQSILQTMVGVPFALRSLRLLIKLHGLIKAVDDPQSVYAAIRNLLRMNIKGAADLRLDEAFAEFITRDKMRILMEEEKRKH